MLVLRVQLQQVNEASCVLINSFDGGSSELMFILPFNLIQWLLKVVK